MLTFDGNIMLHGKNLGSQYLFYLKHVPLYTVFVISYELPEDGCVCGIMAKTCCSTAQIKIKNCCADM